MTSFDNVDEDIALLLKRAFGDSGSEDDPDEAFLSEARCRFRAEYRQAADPATQYSPGQRDQPGIDGLVHRWGRHDTLPTATNRLPR
jgi:hypothetical protein